jgi:hypothetical protein
MTLSRRVADTFDADALRGNISQSSCVVVVVVAPATVVVVVVLVVANVSDFGLGIDVSDARRSGEADSGATIYKRRNQLSKHL